MAPKDSDDVKAAALAKLEKLQKSPNYKSFFNDAAIDAFSKVAGSAFAGKRLSEPEGFDATKTDIR